MNLSKSTFVSIGFTLLIGILFQNFLPSQLPRKDRARVFLIDSTGQPLTVKTAAILTFRKQLKGKRTWEAPQTISNRNAPKDFSGAMVLDLDLTDSQQVALGVYLPVGYRVYRWTSSCPEIERLHPPPLDDPQLVQISANPILGESVTDDFLKIEPQKDEQCFAFIFDDQSKSYSAFAKKNPDRHGIYHENAFSSAMGVNNVPRNQTIPLQLNTKSHYSVRAEISPRIGGVIQSLSLKKNENSPEIQLIKNDDIADSGMQWNMILNGVSVEGSQQRFRSLLYNQAIGADPYWMWGLEMPMEKASNGSQQIAAKADRWVPLFSDLNRLQGVDPQWDATQFHPQSPLFTTNSVHLFDGRVEEVSLARTTKGQTARITSRFRVRSHLLKGQILAAPTAADQVCCHSATRYEWIALRRDELMKHQTQFYYTDDDGQVHSVGSLDEQWLENSPSCLPMPTSQIPVSAPCGKMRLNKIKALSMVIDPGTREEQVVAFHLPADELFDGSVEFTSKNVHDLKVMPGKYWTNSTLLIMLRFESTGMKKITIPADFDVTDSFQISIGDRQLLKDLSHPLNE